MAGNLQAEWPVLFGVLFGVLEQVRATALAA